MQMIVLVWLVLLPATSIANSAPSQASMLETARPDFAAIRDVQRKKSTFFDYLNKFLIVRQNFLDPLSVGTIGNELSSIHSGNASNNVFH